MPIAYDVFLLAANQAKLLLVAVLFFRLRLRWRGWFIALYVAEVAAIVGARLLGLPLENFDKLILTLLALVNTLLLLQGKRKWLVTLVSFLVLSVVESLLAGILYTTVFSLNPMLSFQNMLLNLAINCFFLGLILFVYFVFFRKQSEGGRRRLSPLQAGDVRQITFLALFALSSILLYVGTIFYGAADIVPSLKAFIIIAGGVNCIAFALLFGSSIRNLWKKATYQKKNSIYAAMLESQAQYYDDLLAQEFETRRFRHDIQNHLDCIDELLASHRYQAARAYLADTFELARRTDRALSTGNQIVDVAVNQIMTREDFADVAWDGLLPEALNVSDVDLCILFSNLLKNAVAAAKGCAGPRTVQVRVRYDQDHMLVVVQNPVQRPVRMRGGRPVVPAAQNRVHGYGLLNVEEIVEKHAGSVRYRSEENIFCTEIVLMRVLVPQGYTA